MNNKEEGQHTRLNTLKWSIIWGLTIAGIGANYYFSNIAVPLRLIAWLALICIIGLIALQTSRGKQTWEFAQQSRIELRKVVWPSREETIKMTGAVIFMVILVALVLWAIDSGLLWVMGLLTEQRG